MFVVIATYLSGYAVDHNISATEQFISWSILGKVWFDNYLADKQIQGHFIHGQLLLPTIY